MSKQITIKSQAYHNFIHSLRSDATKEDYSKGIRYLMEYLHVTDYEELITKDVKVIQKTVGTSAGDKLDWSLEARSKKGWNGYISKKGRDWKEKRDETCAYWSSAQRWWQIAILLENGLSCMQSLDNVSMGQKKGI